MQIRRNPFQLPGVRKQAGLVAHQGSLENANDSVTQPAQSSVVSVSAGAQTIPPRPILESATVSGTRSAQSSVVSVSAGAQTIPPRPISTSRINYAFAFQQRPSAKPPTMPLVDSAQKDTPSAITDTIKPSLVLPMANSANSLPLPPGTLLTTPVAQASRAALPFRSGQGARVFSAQHSAVLALPETEVDSITGNHDLEGFERINATQLRYRSMSRVNPTGAVVPATMAEGTWSALVGLRERVGDIDEWLCRRMRWTIPDLARYLTSEQVDSVALALDAADRHEGLIIADQTGFGKGRSLAAIARATVLSGRKVVFLTEKANLFSDFWRDIRDIGSEEVFGRPFMLNAGARIVDTSSAQGHVLVTPWKKADVDRAVRNGALPDGSAILLATYSQFNRKGRKVEFLESVSSSGHIILDEAHNFVGASTTGKTVGAAVSAAGGSTFSSATFARDVTNLAAYTSVFPWLSRVSGLEEMSPGHRRALSEESVRLATQSGRIIRREHDLSNMVLRMSTAEGTKLQGNKALGDAMAPVLSRMAKLARRVDAILFERNETNRVLLESLPSLEERKNEREVWLTANFGSRLSAILQQFLVALNVDPCVDMCVESLLRGEKPVVVIESTMESLMRELSRDPDVEAVEGTEASENKEDSPQGSLDIDSESGDTLVGETTGQDANPRLVPVPTFRSALVLLADRLLKVGVRQGVAFEKTTVVLDEPGLAMERDAIMGMIDGFPDLSLSPIDDLRDRVESRGRELFEQGRIPAPWIADEISARGMRVVDGHYATLPAADRNQVVARFVNGVTHMLVLTQAASTGLSIHDSDKFADHARRHMIELSPPRNVLARIQMWGRVWRRGQLTEPVFSVLDTGLAFHSFDLAARNRKLGELSASVTGTSQATVSLNVCDPINAVGNEVAYEFLQEQQAIAEAMGISLNVDKEEADRELYFVGKLFRRLPLLVDEKQRKVCQAFYAAYDDRIRNGADIQSGRHLEGVWTPVRRGILEAGDGSNDPMNGQDVTVTTLQSQRMASPMTSLAVVALAEQARSQLPSSKPFAAHIERLREIRPALLEAARSKKRYTSIASAMAASDDNPVRQADRRIRAMADILREIVPGVAARLPGQDGEVVDGIVVELRVPSAERANIAREYQISFVVPGDEHPRTTSLDAVVRDNRTAIFGRDIVDRLLGEYDTAPVGNVFVERKIIDGNGVGSVLASSRMAKGTRITYADPTGRYHSAILLPRAAERSIVSERGRTNMAKVAASVFALGGRLLTNLSHPADGVEIRVHPRGAQVVIPQSRRAAKMFETSALLAITGDFEDAFRERVAIVGKDKILSVLDVIASQGCDFFFEAAFRDAAVKATRELVQQGLQPGLGAGVGIGSPGQIVMS